MSAFFVTATGTDIGKTFVTAGLVRHLIASGRAVDALKPVISGYDEAASTESDSGVLLHALGLAITPDSLAAISPWRFRAPLAPDLAAAREGRVLDIDAVIEHSRSAAHRCNGVLLIEGVGGIMVPLDARRTVLDWMTALHLPVVLVTGSYLGTISHTLTALDVLRRADLEVRAVVISESAGATVSLNDTAATIQRFAGDVGVFALPRPASDSSFAPIAALL